MAKIKRSLFKTFLNTGIPATPVWTLISPGVPSAKIDYGVKTTEEIYIHQDTSSFSVDSYVPGIPVSASAMKGDAAFTFVDAMRKSRAVLGDAETEVVNVWLYKGAAAGLYLAEKQTVNVQIDDFGGEGGKPIQINYTLNFLGDPEIGTFDPAGLEFVGTPSTARLSVLTIDGVTLTPQFKANRIWYSAATTDATNDITAESTDVGAVVAIDNGGDTVVSGAAATWVEGLNVVTITVTVTPDVSTYVVLVTATLGA